MRQDLAGKLAKKQESEGLDHGGRLSEHRARSMLFWPRRPDAGIGLLHLAFAKERHCGSQCLGGIANFGLKILIAVEIVMARRIVA